MKERFRADVLLWDRVLACFYKEHAVVKAIQDGFTDDNNQTLLKRFQYLESLIMNGHFKRCLVK